MSDASSKVAVKSEPAKSAPASAAQPRAIDSLRREVDRLFETFDRGLWLWPFGRSVLDMAPAWNGEPAPAAPSVDVVEKDRAYEISAELPGMDEKNVEVTLANGTLTIKGEKREAQEESRKGYYVAERRYGAFERRFRVPDGVDADKIEAAFDNGVLTVTLPKTAASRQAEKKIAVKAA